MAPNTNNRSSQARRSYFYNDDSEKELTEAQRRRRKIFHYVFLFLKIGSFVAIWVFFTYEVLVTPDNHPTERLVVLESNKEFVVLIEEPRSAEICIHIRGNLDADTTAHPKMAKDSQEFFTVVVHSFDRATNESVWQSENWQVYLSMPGVAKLEYVKKYVYLDTGPSSKNIAQRAQQLRSEANNERERQVKLVNNNNASAAVALSIDTTPMNLRTSVIASCVLLCVLYVLIIWDITDRTFGALLMATAAIGMLCVLGERPSLPTIIKWIDMDTLMLLFGMMIMVTIMGDTGVFGYISVTAYRVSKGHPWLLIFLLCMLTVVLSAFLDCVTILMLMVPIVIRLCECMALRTTTVIVCVAIFANIGGTLTPVGDPPNVIIATNEYVVASGVDFCIFVMHMIPGTLISVCGAWLYLYLVLRKSIHKGSDEQMRKSLNALSKQAEKLKDPTPSEQQLRLEILTHIEELKEQFRRRPDRPNFGPQPVGNYIETLAEMQAKYKVTDKPLLIKCCIVLTFAILLFSLNALPLLAGATLSWTAFLSAVLLLILVNYPTMERVLSHIEWSTLIFFASLFVFIEACSEMGLIDWVSELAASLIKKVDEEHRVVTSIMLVMWISALFSAVVDNIPVVTMMLKLAVNLSLNDDLKVPLLPMVWALSYGVCFGGNATLIAASSNVVAAGLANQHGYKITFIEFFKYGFPVMLISDIIASIYLLFAHAVFTWH